MIPLRSHRISRSIHVVDHEMYLKLSSGEKSTRRALAAHRDAGLRYRESNCREQGLQAPRDLQGWLQLHSAKYITDIMYGDLR